MCKPGINFTIQVLRSEHLSEISAAAFVAQYIAETRYIFFYFLAIIISRTGTGAQNAGNARFVSTKRMGRSHEVVRHFYLRSGKQLFQSISYNFRCLRGSAACSIIVYFRNIDRLIQVWQQLQPEQLCYLPGIEKIWTNTLCFYFFIS